MPPHPIPEAIFNGQKTVTTAGTQVQLTAHECRTVSIKALKDNAGYIYLGDADVSSSNGRQLEAGEVFDIAVDEVDRLWIDSAEDGDGVSWLGVV